MYNRCQVLSSMSTHCEVYSQHLDEIKFVSDFNRADQWFSQGTLGCLHQQKNEILLKVAIVQILKMKYEIK